MTIPGEKNSLPCDDKVNIPLNIQFDCLGKNKESTIENSNSVETTDVYLAETANSISIQEIDISHITNNDIKTQFFYASLLTTTNQKKIKETNLKVNIMLTGEIPVVQ